MSDQRRTVRPTMTETAPQTSGKLTTSDVCALTCGLGILAEGLFLIAARPNPRIIWLVLTALLVVALIWVTTRRYYALKTKAFQFATHVFPIVLTVCGLFYLSFFQPGTVPDEDYHYGYSYAYANLLDPSMGASDMRLEDYAFLHNETLYGSAVTANYWERQDEGLSVFATHEGTITSTDDVGTIDFGTNPAQLKLASALLIALGRLLGLSGIVVFYLGRIGNFLFAGALIVCAIRLTPVGRTPMMCCALLPMTLHVLGSYSYDAGTIGLAFLLTALLLRVAYGRERPSNPLLAATVVVAVLLAPCKTIYGIITLFALFIDNDRFSSKRAALVWKTCMIALPLAFMVALRLPKILQVLSAKQAHKRVDLLDAAETEKTTYSLGPALADPMGVLMMLLRSMFYQNDMYLQTLVGGSLGWFQQDIIASDVQVFILTGIVALSIFRSPGDGRILAPRMRLAGVLIFAGGVLLTFLVFLFDHTVIGDKTILGVQGRYFIPYLPLFLSALRGHDFKALIDTAPLLTMAEAGLGLLYLAQIAFVALGGPVA